MTKRAPAKPKHEDLAESVIAGDRRALARAITLIESTRADHRAEAAALLDKLLPAAGKSIRLGISGAPGVGKSTFIEAFGLHVIGQGHRVAVLAVDPSSKIGGGSILGDKTRMTDLATEERAFIRPSPAGGTLGGVARRTRESITAVEGAGFDVVVVETVGVGQSETAVADMVDMFVLMLQPGGGDDLQGMKRGIVELADLILVNKSDGELAAAAGRTAADYRHALHLLRAPTPGWTPVVRTMLGPVRRRHCGGLADRRALPPGPERRRPSPTPPQRAGQGSPAPGAVGEPARALAQRSRGGQPPRRP